MFYKGVATRFFKYKCTFFARFWQHYFDLHTFLLCQKIGRFVRTTLASCTFCRGNVLPFPADSGKASFQLLAMEYAQSSG